ncbi:MULTISPECIES: copper chaperone PCu(A)C [Stappiaceae]|jgi:copper(I)-binding protein|uniref:copper chaperone PCu(A)C n=1 Tax=Stappiaceae TaxID=2821832 RepID=UPI001446FA02|nr:MULTISPECIES: copper chaperone PCu(A)C [Stappiaceae]MBO9463565.1 copper chaperone PCu(A)C [Labrenzia sp. R5_0]MEC9421122.1 copper chaperone PCu(A)C [Pseudomonadota bacterium]NKX68215.1 copper chaperone PCu(A)C [Labrenzia sp. 5N]UES41905.1 copper chaperone PCu(A)C [Roseibium aggregatum]
MKKDMVKAAAIISVWCGSLQQSFAQMEHTFPENKLVVEHANVVRSVSNMDTLFGYVTIWNGTNQAVNISEIYSEELGVASVYSVNYSDVDPVFVEYPLTIPAHAELMMRPSGIYLELKRENVGFEGISEISLTLEFEDKTSLQVPAEILVTGEDLPDHHHGDGKTYGHD